VYVKEAEVAFVGLDGEDVIAGAGLAARAVQVPQPLTARTPSSAAGFSSLALLVALCELRVNIGIFSSSRGGSCVGGIDGCNAGWRAGSSSRRPSTAMVWCYEADRYSGTVTFLQASWLLPVSTILIVTEPGETAPAARLPSASGSLTVVPAAAPLRLKSLAEQDPDVHSVPSAVETLTATWARFCLPELLFVTV
jgi:hypothetical protein